MKKSIIFTKCDDEQINDHNSEAMCDLKIINAYDDDADFSNDPEHCFSIFQYDNNTYGLIDYCGEGHDCATLEECITILHKTYNIDYVIFERNV